MLSGKGGDVTKSGVQYCGSTNLSEKLFIEFRALDELARAFQGEEGQPIVKLGAKELRLSKGVDKNGGDYYSRITRMDNGKWVAVQIRVTGGDFFTGSFFGTTVFDGEGNKIASMDRTSCITRNLVVSPRDKELGKDILIEGALRAVTGRSYKVEVE